MLEILRVPWPPLPGGMTGVLLGAGSVGAGLALLLAGRLLWRLLAAAGLALTAAALAWKIADWYDLPLPMLWVILAGVALAVVGFALARLVWALLLAAAMSAAAALGVIHHAVARAAAGQELPKGFIAQAGLNDWAVELAKTLYYWWEWLTPRHLPLLLTAVGIAALLGLLIGLIRPVLTRIFATSAGGAACIVGGSALAVGALWPGADLWSGWRRWAVLGALAGLTLAGMVIQYRAELRSQRRYGETEAQPPTLKPAAGA